MTKEEDVKTVVAVDTEMTINKDTNYAMSYVRIGRGAWVAKITARETETIVTVTTWSDGSETVEEKAIGKMIDNRWNSQAEANALYNRSTAQNSQGKLLHVFLNSYTKDYMLWLIKFMRGYGL